MGSKNRGGERLPEVYVTRKVAYPEDLKEVFDDITRGLGSAAFLFARDDISIPLFKLSALPSLGKVDSDTRQILIGQVERQIARIDTEISVPVYPVVSNGQPTLFSVDNSTLAIRLLNNYDQPKAIDPKGYITDLEKHVIIADHEMRNCRDGGQIDYMVRLAVEAVRQAFPDDPIGPDHRGYINGRDRRARAAEIYDYLTIGGLTDEYFHGMHDPPLMPNNPEGSLKDRGIVIDYPEHVVFGAMQIQIRERNQNRGGLK